ncbi:unnamed protein product [Clonostachys chloroleuca]|uniref:Uncharacterized protein n=1 Tax=Clonostachys chloroleuca TaxID=1926264 RepID=A0AA35PZE2_9HYPO|nr:unnamed protein product [Clonostachys chloroleuca]
MCAHVGPRFTYKLSKQLDTRLRYRFSPVLLELASVRLPFHIHRPRRPSAIYKSRLCQGSESHSLLSNNYRLSLLNSDHNNEIIYVENYIENHDENHIENLINERNRIHNLRDVYDCNHIIRKPHE